MIVSCPSCSSRYRIRDDKVKGRGARITCPSCQHKFIVHREAEPMVVGGEARGGVPVTFARGGQTMRGEFEEDDEADVPTTVMPHGSQVAQSIRAAAEFQRLQAERAEAQEAAASPAAPAASADDGARQLRASARQAAAPASSGPSIVRLLVMGVVGILMGLILLAVLGVIPMP